MPRLLVQLSDTHIRAPGELAERRVDTAEALERAVAAVQALPIAPEAVLVTGDCVDSGKPAQYAHLRRLLAPLAAPVYLLPGNHDDRDAMRTAFPEATYLCGEPAFVHYAVELPGLRLVAVDTSVGGAPHGELGDAQLAALDRTLAQGPTTPTIVALHHPPFRTFIERMDDYGLRVGTDALAAVISRHAQVERIVCGHLHRAIQSRFAGTVAATAPSTAHALAFDLGADVPLAWTREPAGFVAHVWSAGAPLTSHVVYSGDYDGPHPFAFAG